MHDMKKIRELLNQQLIGPFAAVIIVVVAVIVPVLGFRDLNFQDVEFGFLSVIIPLLYVVAVVGFVYLSLGKQGRNITSKESDEKISKACNRVQKKLKPFYWAFVVSWLIVTGYLVWKLIVFA